MTARCTPRNTPFATSSVHIHFVSLWCRAMEDDMIPEFTSQGLWHLSGSRGAEWLVAQEAFWESLFANRIGIGPRLFRCDQFRIGICQIAYQRPRNDDRPVAAHSGGGGVKDSHCSGALQHGPSVRNAAHSRQGMGAACLACHRGHSPLSAPSFWRVRGAHSPASPSILGANTCRNFL